MPSTRTHRPAPLLRRAFTLIELLVVVSILGVLAALLMPAVQGAREAARRTGCTNNLRQIGLALAAYVSDRGALPVGCVDGGFFPAQNPRRLTAWTVRVLPFLEEQALADAYDDTLPASDWRNRPVARPVEALLCPGEPNERLAEPAGDWLGCAYSDYGGLYGVEGVGHDAPFGAEQTLRDESLGVLVYDTPVAPREITDGLSHTLAVAERLERRVTRAVWTNGRGLFAQEKSTPVNTPSALGGDLGGPHPGGALSVACDGHLVWLDESMDQPVLNALLTRAGGETAR